MYYELHEDYGRGITRTVRFVSWEDVAEHVEIVGLAKSVDDGRTTITRHDEPCYLLEWDEYPYYRVVMPDELPGMHHDAIAHGYGHESDFDSWMLDMQRWHILEYHG